MDEGPRRPVRDERWRRVRQRDRDEFERVFRSAYRSVLGSTYLVLHDRGRAEEVTQDAFVRLYERWGKAVSIDHPVAWVRTVAVGTRSAGPSASGSSLSSRWWTARARARPPP